MRRILALFLLLAASAHADPRKWNDTLRDVYIDGTLDRTVQTLATSDPRMLALVMGDDVYVFESSTKLLSHAAKSGFTFADDRTSATTDPALTRDPMGAVAMPDEASYLARIGGRLVLVTSHQSHAGVMTTDDLWSTAPVWRAIYDRYTPDAAAVERLKAIAEPTSIRIVFATWCGDSRYHVPRLLKALAAADNPKIDVQLFGLGPRFLSPMATIEEQNIINVPTVIVSRDGREVGRYIETPAAKTVEEDIAAIAAGEAKAHPGRWSRKEKIAEGTYELRGAGRVAVGMERFELWEREKGGILAHSVIALRAGGEIETWATLDENREADFAEVTYRTGSHTTRARYFAETDSFSAHSRGDESGIVDQTLAKPEHLALMTPATVTFGWPLMQAARKERRGPVTVYCVPQEGTVGIGRMETMRFLPKGPVLAPLRNVPRDGEEFAGTTAHGTFRVVVHSALRVPLVVEADGVERRLISLTGTLPQGDFAAAK